LIESAVTRTTQPLGEAPTWLEALERVSAAAPFDRPILVVGERGVGKELIAERVHFLSSRWGGPLIRVNCAALPQDLLDSELFGYEAGAFTGAQKRRAGRFELADKGTLFLDEIATASPQVQEKLLRVVEYGEFQRLGGEVTLTVDVRLVAATNVDLPSLAAKGKFRADLLDRLSFEVVTVPPLRARRSDVRLLAEFFGKRMAQEAGERFVGFSPSALAVLEAYSWPGNVRELKNVAERATYRAMAARQTGQIMITEDLLDPFRSPWRPAVSLAEEAPGSEGAAGDSPAAARPLPEMALPVPQGAQIAGDFDSATRAYEMALIDAALDACQHHQGEAAKRLGLSYHRLRALLRKYGYVGGEAKT
jgi:psp operon transcriptional activator